MKLAVGLIVGIACIIVGVLLAARPQIVKWLSDQINLRGLRSMGVRFSPKAYDKDVRNLKIVLPLFFFLFGAAWIVWGLAS